jgi:hypothetical protein
MRGKTLKHLDDISLDKSETNSPRNIPVSLSRETAYSEMEVIDIALKIINLLEMLHTRDIIHTNICPQTIFLKNQDIN